MYKKNNDCILHPLKLFFTPFQLIPNRISLQHMETLNKPKKVHIGRNIARIRELKGMKQEALAAQLGVTQQTVSKMEQSEVIDDEKLKQIANALGVTTEAIQNFNEGSLFFNIESMHDHSSAGNTYHQPTFTFNPVDKIVELYERLLASEREKNEMLKGK